MKIRYRNDKKEARYSHTFNADGDDSLVNCSFGWALVGYGATKKEAAEEAKRALKLLIADIEKCLETFKD